MFKKYIFPLFLLVGLLEARVVNDEYHGDTIRYSKEAYNKMQTEYWEKKTQRKKVYKKQSKKYKKSRRYTKKRVHNDEYQGDTIRYSSDIRMSRAEWEAKHKNRKKVRYNKSSSNVVNDEYRGDSIKYDR